MSAILSRSFRHTSLLIAVLLLSVIVAGVWPPLPVGEARVIAEPIARARQAYGQLPLRFEANRGQADARAKFLARGNGYTIFLTADEAVLEMRNDDRQTSRTQRSALSTQHSTLRMKLLGSHLSAPVVGIERMQSLSNYFLGGEARRQENWLTGVTHYAKVKYEDVYPGVDLIYYGNQQQLEYDFELAPGADPRRIKLAMAGAETARIDDQGDLALSLNGGEVRWRAPRAWQEIDGRRREVVCRYRVQQTLGQMLGPAPQISFELGEYDNTRALVIDPQLVYSTYLGGLNSDSGLGVAVDGAGNAYVCGQTASLDFPTGNAVQPSKSSGADAFVLKLDPNGTSALYATYLGGNSTDAAYSIAVDAFGNAFIAGETVSTNFPTTTGAAQKTSAGGADGFIAKLNASGSALEYSTLLGGADADRIYGVAVDASGNAYLTGQTDSTNFPTSSVTSVKSGAPLFKTTNSGGTWSNNSSGLTASSMNAIAVDPTDARVVYAASLNRVYRSNDGGNQWDFVGMPPLLFGFSATLHGLAIDPKAPNTLYLATSLGVAKSVNGGQSFTFKNTGLLSIFVTALAIDPNNPATLYAVTQFGVYKSTNGGESWFPSSTGLGATGGNLIPRRLLIDPVNPSTLYAGTARGVFKTIDGAASWTAINKGLGGAGADGPDTFSLGIDPASPMTIYAGVNSAAGVLFKSIDGGANWSASQTGLSVTINGKTTRPIPSAIVANAGVVYAGTAVGVYKSADGGGAWALSSEGLTTRAINALAIDPNNPAALYAGALAGSDGFVAKLNATGSMLIYSLYLGGSEPDQARGIAVDAAGSAWVTGQTYSPDFPRVNATQPYGGGADAFAAKVNAAGSALEFATHLGGSGLDFGGGVALDGAGNVYLAGYTQSIDFPVVKPLKGIYGGGQFDGFVTKLSSAGAALYSTYLGGTREDQVLSIAVDATGNAWVAGVTNSSDFPAVGSLQQPNQGTNDVFVTKLNPAGSQFTYSTFLGGSGNEQGNAIAVDVLGNAFVAGTTTSSNFPTVTPLQSYRSSGDAFIAKLGPVVDLAVTITDAPDPATYGGNLTYNIKVSNLGDSAATGVKLTNQLPAGATLVSINPSQGVCLGGPTINCDFGNLANDAAATVAVIVNPPATRSIASSVSVAANQTELNTENNKASTTTQVDFADVSLGLTQTHLQIGPGGQLTWFIAVKNNGPSRAANVVVSDNLPAETTFVACQTSAGGVCGGTGNNRTVTFTALDANATATVALSATVNSGVAPGRLVINSASLNPLASDPNPSNDQATTTTTVTAPVDPQRKNGMFTFDDGSSYADRVYLSQIDGSRRFPLATGTQPAWSPDGLKVAFVTRFSPYGVFIINADGTELRQLTTGGESSPSWSPDGTRLAFVRGRAVFIINADGTGERPVPNITDAFFVRWSPDGAKLLACSNSLTSFNLDGSGAFKLPGSSSAGPIQANWSPDSSRIVAVSDGAAYTVNADGSGFKTLTSFAGYKRWPVWSPDGKQIAFLIQSSFSVVTGKLVIVNADGTGAVTVLSDLAATDSTLDWQRAPAQPQPKTFIISGRVRATGDRSPFNLLVELSGTRNAETGTSAGGYFAFGNLPEGGNYNVTVSLSSYRVDPPSRTFTDLKADQSNVDFDLTFIPNSISGRIVDASGDGLGNVNVIMTSGSSTRVYTETDPNGYYSFNFLSDGGNRTISPVDFQLASPSFFDPPSVSYSNFSGNRIANFIGTRGRINLTGRLLDGGGAPISGATVTLSGARSGTMTSDAQGRYTFPGLPSGYAYTVTPTKEGQVFAPASRTVIPVRGHTVDFFSGVSSATAVSAASFAGPTLAVGGIAALFGSGLAETTTVATGSSLPFELGGVSVTLVGKYGGSHGCQLFFVSPQQINFIVSDPASSNNTELSRGEALLVVRRAGKVAAAGTVQLDRLAPALFTADGSGRGLAAGVALRVKADGSQVFEPLARFDAALNQFVPIPIDLGPESENVFLVLFGTGLRARGDLSSAQMRIGGEPAAVGFAGPAPGLFGVDQVNAAIPRALAGRGLVDVSLTVDGRAANNVRVALKQ